MNEGYLTPLINRYGPWAGGEFDKLGVIVKRRCQARNTRLIDLAAMATSLSIDGSRDVNSLALKAIHDTIPTLIRRRSVSTPIRNGWGW